MAKLRVFSAFDAKVTKFHNPYLVDHIGDALRIFARAVNEEGTAPNAYPSDFQLYDLGEFDNNDGTFASWQPRLVISALEVKTPDKALDPQGSLAIV